MTKSNMKLPEIWAEHQRLKEVYEKARAAESAARSNCTTLRNEINDVQRHMDAAIAEEKKSSPEDSDWARNSSRKVTVRKAVNAAEKKPLSRTITGSVYGTPEIKEALEEGQREFQP